MSGQNCLILPPDYFSYLNLAGRNPRHFEEWFKINKTFTFNSHF